MPQAKRSTTTRVTSKFKQPAALKRLSTSLDSAQKALGELSKGSGREVSKGAKDIYADLRKFVADAGRESTKVGKALQREFDQAQKQLAKARTSSRSASSRSAAKPSTSKRSTAKRSTTARSTSSRSASARSTSSRSTSGRSTTRRASSGSGSTKRSSTSSKRGTSKS